MGVKKVKVECSDVDIGVRDSVLIQIDILGVPRVGILNTFAGEYRDSVRFDSILVRLDNKIGMRSFRRYMIFMMME